jgi:hypothetical protein
VVVVEEMTVGGEERTKRGKDKQGKERGERKIGHMGGNGHLRDA